MIELMAISYHSENRSTQTTKEEAQIKLIAKHIAYSIRCRIALFT